MQRGSTLAVYGLAFFVIVACAACGSPAPESCTSRALAFNPAAGARYAMVVQEHDSSAAPDPSREPYRSTLSFARVGGGWRVVERGFNPLRNTPAQVGDLTAAEARWTLDVRGVPSAPVEEHGQAREGILQHLSFFAFRPVGYAFRSTCPGEVSTSAWTDPAGRVRTFEFRIGRIERDVAVLSVRGTVATAANTWSVQGELRVSVTDGLIGEARLHETGPGAPAVNDRQRIVRITRE